MEGEGVRGGAATLKNILEARGAEEDSSCSLWAQLPPSQPPAAPVGADPHPLSPWGPGSSQSDRQVRTDRSGWEGGWERREILGLKWKTSFFSFSFLFLSSPMWKRHSARRKTAADRTQRDKEMDGQFILHRIWKRNGSNSFREKQPPSYVF